MAASNNAGGKARSFPLIKNLFNVKKFFPKNLEQKKSSAFPSYFFQSYISAPGKPVWMSRDYEKFSDEGFQKNVIAYRSISLVASAVSSVPFMLYEKSSGKEIKNHKILELLRKPNPSMNWVEFIESLIAYKLISGNSFIQMVKDFNEEVKELYLLRPDRVSIITGRNYMPAAYRYNVDGAARDFSINRINGKSDILHIKNFHPLSDWQGMSPFDGATNQPNVFYDPNSVESYFPYFSRGRIDFRAQRTGLMGTEKKWKSSSMVENKFIWTYDARPFPFFPDLSGVWADGYLWKYGHWINGKLGLSNLAAIVADICVKSGLSYSDFDVSRLNELVDGFILAEPVTAKTAIETLQTAYFFDAVESDGIIKFIPRGGTSQRTIDESELVFSNQNNNKDLIKTRHLAELALPQRVDIQFINRVQDYQPGKQHSQKIVTSSLDNLSVSFPIVMDEGQAKRISDITLFNLWQERNIYHFTLPPKHLDLDASDVVDITKNGANIRMRIVETLISTSGAIEAVAVSEDVSVYDFAAKREEPKNQPEIIQDPGKTRTEFIDIPALPQDPVNQGVMRFAVNGFETSWHGAALYRSDDNGASYSLMASVDSGAVIGSTVNILGDSTCHKFDRKNKLTVILTNGTLESVSDLALLNGRNIALVGEELIQFKNAALLAPNKYELSILLRGRMGTENKTVSHLAGEKFILLDEKLIRLNMPASLIGVGRKYKGVSYGASINAADALDNIYRGNSLKPFAPVHIKGVRDVSGNLTIKWVRRTRVNGDLRDYADIPLNEAKELYEVEILNGVNVVRTIKNILTSETAYSAANQVTDFGSSQSNINVRIYQMSDVVGRGTAAIATV